MSKSEVLYVKSRGMKVTTESDPEDEDVWDDTKLKAAYEKALRLANATEVAQRVAMATNSQNKSVLKQSRASGGGKHGKKQWKDHMYCRAVYEGDGLEYEAKIQKIVSDNHCIVVYLGYNNSELVPLESLKPSHGKDAQEMQILQAAYDKEEEMSNSEKMDVSDGRSISPTTTVIDSERSYQQRRRKSTKKKKSGDRVVNGFRLPDVPMPNMNMLSNLGLSNNMPMPPPPPLNFSAGQIDNEDQAMSSMLLSWYMSGYYAGLYQGLKRSKERRSSR